MQGVEALHLPLVGAAQIRAVDFGEGPDEVAERAPLFPQSLPLQRRQRLQFLQHPLQFRAVALHHGLFLAAGRVEFGEYPVAGAAEGVPQFLIITGRRRPQFLPFLLQFFRLVHGPLVVVQGGEGLGLVHQLLFAAAAFLEVVAAHPP